MNYKGQTVIRWGAAKAQWIRLHRPSCYPGFESRAYHLSFYKFIVVSCEKDENKRKEAGIGTFFLKKTLWLVITTFWT